MYTLLSWVEYMSVYSTLSIEWILTHSTQLNWMHQLYSTQLNWVERNAWVWVYPYIHYQTEVKSYPKAPICKSSGILKSCTSYWKSRYLQMDQFRQNGAFEDEYIVEKRSIWVWLKGIAGLLGMSQLRKSRAFENEYILEKRSFWLFLDLGKVGLMRMSSG